MHQSGVTPMPPAINSVCLASSASGKLLRGALIVMMSPVLSLSCTQVEPPRLTRSFCTATT